LLPAARADLLRRLGRKGEAADAYRQALSLATNDIERRFCGAGSRTLKTERSAELKEFKKEWNFP